jgi:hypothetical protein
MGGLKMYCNNCGKEIDDNAIACPHCGVATKNAQNNSQPPVNDNGGIGWGILGCCIPIVGLILFLVWKDTKPNSAKAAGIGALVGVGISLIYYLIIIVAGVGIGVAGSM